MRVYTQEELRFLRRNIKGRSYVEITELFNKHFGRNISFTKMRGVLVYHQIRNKRNTRFYPGIPCQFKGYPVGAERINGYGYVEIKVADNPSRWRKKHVLIWEKENGKTPKGHRVIFADKNKYNFALENLLLISMKELAVMNSLKFISNSMDLTKTGKAIADLTMAINARKRGMRKNKKSRTKSKMKTGGNNEKSKNLQTLRQ
jgi:hypothetical protein